MKPSKERSILTALLGIALGYCIAQFSKAEADTLAGFKDGYVMGWRDSAYAHDDIGLKRLTIEQTENLIKE